MHKKGNPVEIKGQKDGLWIYVDEQVSPQEMFSALEKKLASSNNFFSGAEVTINVGARVLSAEEHARLREIIEQTYQLRIKDVTHLEIQERHVEELSEPHHRDGDPEEVKERPSRSEIDSDLTERTRNSRKHSSEQRTEEAPEDDPNDDDFMKFVDETFQIPVQQTWKPKQTYSSEYLYENEETAFYFRGTVRSGQTLEYPGNIVILGDVNPGAYVIASGDIIVMGRLHGVVHAGAEGEEQAVVIGASFTPSQLRIAQYIGRPPDEQPGSRSKQSQTEKAYIKDGAIVIEPIL